MSRPSLVLERPLPAVPAWAEGVEAVSGAVTALAIVVGGVFAYFRFVSGRTIHPRLNLTVEAEHEVVDGHDALVVTVTARNDGQGKVTLVNDPARPHFVAVYPLDDVAWEVIRERGMPVDWDLPDPVVWPVWPAPADDPWELEPAEVVVDTVMLPLPAATTAVRVDLYVTGVSGTWFWRTAKPAESSTLVVVGRR